LHFVFEKKTPFYSEVTPFPQNNVAKRFVDVYLFPTLKKRGRGGYLSQRERAEFTPRKKVGNFHVNNFCP